MGKIELDHTGSGSGITLSSDGTDLLLDGTAIGGGGGGGASAQTIDIKTADYTVVSGDLGKIIKYVGAGADRTVTLTAGATLGDGFHVTILNANTGADERVVIDANSIEKFGWQNGPQTITLSRGELVRIIWDNSSGRWIIGEGGFNLAMRSDVNPATTTAAGDGSNGAVAIGHNSIASGSISTALGRSNASGTYAFAASVADNTTTYGASGSNSVAMGYQAKASASDAVSIGDRNIASGDNSVVFGETNTGSGAYSFTAGRNNTNSGSRGIALGNANTVSSFYTFASGSQNTASSNYAHAVGSKSLADRQGKFAHASLGFGTVGDSQYGRMILSKATTDATATVLTAIQGNTAASVNMPVIPSGGAQAFSGLVVAKQTSSANAAAWEIKGLIVNNGGTTTLVNSAITVIDNTPSWGGPALSADDTNDWLAITCTGAASTSIRWSCTLNTSELIYA